MRAFLMLDPETAVNAEGCATIAQRSAPIAHLLADRVQGLAISK